MDSGSEAYSRASKEWKATCRILLGRERFADAKRMLQEHLLAQLEKKKDVALSIFNAACAGKEG